MASSSPKQGKESGAAHPPGATGFRPGPDPVSRSFVVQVVSDREDGDDAFTGRVQHLATADGGNFANPEGLVAIMRRVLRRSAGEAGGLDDADEEAAKS